MRHLDKQTKERILLAASWMAMGAFVWFAFLTTADDNAGGELTNPADLDDSPSKTAILVEKQKRERRSLDFDRHVYTMDHFFATQVTTNPIDSVPPMEPPASSPDVESGAQTQPLPVETAYSAPTAVGEPAVGPKVAQGPEPERKTRRAGFASGGQPDLNPNPGGEPGDGVVAALAVVHQEIRVRSGSDIKLRLMEPLPIGGVTIRENTFVTGRVTLSQDRIYFDVRSIAQDGDLIKTDLTAFDLTGTRGIFVEGAKEISSDVFTEAVNQAQRRVDVPLLRDVPFSAAKKKIREVEIILSAGHKMYLTSR